MANREACAAPTRRPEQGSGPSGFYATALKDPASKDAQSKAAARADLRDGVDRPRIRRRRCRFYGVSLKNVHHEHGSRHHRYRLHCGGQSNFQRTCWRKAASSIKARSPWSANFSKKEMALQKGKFAAGDSWPRKVTFPQIISLPRRVKLMRTTSLSRRRSLPRGRICQGRQLRWDGDFTNWVGFAKDGTPPRTAGCQKHFLRRMGNLLKMASSPRKAALPQRVTCQEGSLRRGRQVCTGIWGGPPSGSLASQNDRPGHPRTRPTARQGVKPCNSGNRLRQRISGYGYLDTGHHALWMQPSAQLKGGRRGRGLMPQDTQCLTHHEWDHTNLFKPCSSGNGLRSGHH
jgi:hypothetical protein